MAKIQELLEARRESEALAAGASSADVALSRNTGIDARDVRWFCEVTRADRLLIVVRCPKLAARAWHGVFPAKTWAVSKEGKKSGESGALVSARGHAMVSDYDLMGVWRRQGEGFVRIVVSALPPGASRGPFSEEAKLVVRRLNGGLVSRIQHGCQDDWISADNPGVKPGDRFAAFREGHAHLLATASECASYYEKQGLGWPYDAEGKYGAAQPR